MWFKSLTRLCVVFLILFVLPSKCLVYPSIQWTPRNPLFQIPLHQRIHNVLPMSKINIICPNLAMNVDTVLDYTPKEWLYENLWIVSKKSYHKCNASSPRTDRLLLKCDTSLNLKYYTVVFQQYSATLQGLEFPVGEEYYFIATSDGTRASLDNRAGGNCARGSMKMKFYVCKNDQDPKCNQPTTTQPNASAIKPPIITENVITTNRKQTTHMKTRPKPTPKQVVTSPPTQPISTEENKALQSDDPRETLEPTLSTHTTASVPVMTSEPRSEVRMITQEECLHDHGLQTSWNVVIPLLVIIVVLVIMNSFVICRLRQLHPMANNPLEEDGHFKPKKQSFSYFEKEEKKTSIPVSV